MDILEGMAWLALGVLIGSSMQRTTIEAPPVRTRDFTESEREQVIAAVNLDIIRGGTIYRAIRTRSH